MRPIRKADPTEPPRDPNQTLAPALARLQEQGLYRRRRLSESPQRPRMRVDGRDCLSFCGNDYLGLAAHPKLAESLSAAAAQCGLGSGASHLITGHHRHHQALEEALADFVGYPRALLFSTGYMANLGVISALTGPGDLVLGDRLNHASLIDGVRLSGAIPRRYRHGDSAHLEQLATRCRPALIASDGVFSMDGDLAPVTDLARVARQTGAWLLIDDAHGLGVVGPDGRGTLAAAGLNAAQAPMLMGTLGKAFGAFGAFVAGSDELIETLIQRARGYIYTTALPPAMAAATLTALELAKQEHWRREHLHGLISRFRQGAADLGLRLPPTTTPIQPLIAGDSARALDWSQRLEQQGLLVPAIRPPTVPPGQARLRISLSASHEPDHIDRLLDALAQLPEHST